MENFDKRDKHFQSLANQAEQDPPTFIWDEIEATLPVKKKSKKVWLWLLPILLLGALVTNHLTRNIGEAELQSINKAEIDSNLENELIRSAAIAEPMGSTFDQEAILPSNNQESEELFEKEVKQVKISAISKESRKIKVTEPIQRQSQSSERQQVSQESSSNTSTISRTMPSNEILSSANAESKKNAVAQEDQKYHLLTLNPLDRLPNAYLEFPYSIYRASEYTIRSNPFFLELGTAIGLHDMKLTSTHSREISLRESTETNWYTWGITGLVGCQINDNIYLKSGLEYLISRDKFDYVQTNATIRIDSFISSNYKVTTGTYFSEGDITYKQLNIPVSIGGEIQQGRLRIGIEATAVINVNYNTEGKLLTKEYEVSRVETENTYKNNIGLGLRGALLLGMQVSEKGRLYVKPTYATYLSNTNNSTNNVSSRLQQYYFDLSYRYKF